MHPSACVRPLAPVQEWNCRTRRRSASLASVEERCTVSLCQSVGPACCSAALSALRVWASRAAAARSFRCHPPMAGHIRVSRSAARERPSDAVGGTEPAGPRAGRWEWHRSCDFAPHHFTWWWNLLNSENAITSVQEAPLQRHAGDLTVDYWLVTG